MAARLAAEYVLPLRWDDDDDLEELTAYLRWLSRQLDITVVDGSRPLIFERHAASWGTWLRHVRPAVPNEGNGKVAGVITGVYAARHEAVVIADDDVRWDRPGLEQAIQLLECADLVRPQNVFQPMPWHARWDTGRSLINRAFAGDYPGTYALRRSTFIRIGGYAGDVLFENLELARTVRAHGGNELLASALFVPRRPPSTRQFLRQRIRQAYDDFAQPSRLVVEASFLPGALLILGHGRRSTRSLRQTAVAFASALLVAVLIAERGRRAGGGSHRYPRTAALWTPLWMAERAVGIWVAIGYRLAGGMPYAGSRLRLAAHTLRDLRNNAAVPTTCPPDALTAPRTG
jgi:hypothetical protein